MFQEEISQRKTLFSYAGVVQANPPLSSVFQQCYWNQSQSECDNIRDYNDRRCFKQSQRPITSEAGKKHSALLKPRPWSSHVKKTHSMLILDESPASVAGCGASSDSDVKSSSSGCSTPDYMHDVYNQYAQPITPHILLRRPLHQNIDYDETDDVSDGTQSLSDTNKFIENGTFTDNHVSTNTDISFFPNKQNKMQNFAINIPMPTYDAGDVLSSWEEGGEEETDEVLSDYKNSQPANITTTTTELPRSSISSKTKRKIKSKKKTSLKAKKKQAELLNSAGDNDNVERRENKVQPVKKELPENTWRSKEDEIVSQMHALGLVTPLEADDFKLPLRPKSCSHVTSLKKERSQQKNKNMQEKTNILKSKIKSGKNSQEEQVGKHNHHPKTERMRKIPIQIVSDPFKCQRKGSPSRKLHTKSSRRPQSASPYVAKRGEQSAWK